MLSFLSLDLAFFKLIFKSSFGSLYAPGSSNVNFDLIFSSEELKFLSLTSVSLVPSYAALRNESDHRPDH